MSHTALTPLEQKTVLFYEDEIVAVSVDMSGRQQIFVPVRPICDFLGVAWSPQLRRIERDAVLQRKIERVTVTVTDSYRTTSREMICLPLDYLNGWLFGINADRVKPTVRERLIRYQEECYRILADAFLEQRSSFDLTVEAAQSVAILRQIQENALATARLAEEQIRLTARLDKAAVIVGQHERRLTAIEQQLAPREAISDEQATDIAEKVKALALVLTTQDNSKNHFQGIFSELYRRFRVSSYKNIRQSQYHLVLSFLDEWERTAATLQA
jgi:hypothetical protein